MQKAALSSMRTLYSMSHFVLSAHFRRQAKTVVLLCCTLYTRFVTESNKHVLHMVQLVSPSLSSQSACQDACCAAASALAILHCKTCIHT